jgi:hypothetical protein
MTKHTYIITVKKKVTCDVDEPEPELNNPEVNKHDAFECFKDGVAEMDATDEGVTIEEE